MGDDLLKAVQAALDRRLVGDSFIRQFRETLEHDGAEGLKLEDAQEYALKRGEATSGALLDVIRPGVLPDDRMDYGTASRTVLPVLEQNFDNVQDAANQVQKALDRAAGVGLNGVRADFPENRANGLIDKIADSETIEETRTWLGEPVINFSEAGFDKWVKANADFRYKAGMSPKVVRKGHPGMCEWCARLEGTYDYEAVRYGSDVWRRHKHCRCVVLFRNERGSFRDVHSKIDYSNVRDARIARAKEVQKQKETIENAKREIRERIKDGRYSLNLSRQKYAEHVEGTPQWNNTRKTRQRDLGRLTVSYGEAQKLIHLYSGTGTPFITRQGAVGNKEYVTAPYVIGQYFDAGKQEWIDTKRFAIYHGEHGSHIVPVKPGRSGD